MRTEITRVSHVSEYIKSAYPRMNPKKFDVVKIGPRIYLYAVDQSSNLQRFQIFQGNLPAINELTALKDFLEKNIKTAVQKLGFA
jgi:hypothetical protein